MIDEYVQRALRDVLPLVLRAREEGRRGEEYGRQRGRGTHNQNHIRVARLHPRGGRRILVTHKVLCVDYGDYGVHLQVSRRFALQFAQLECERGGKRGATVLETGVSVCSSRGVQSNDVIRTSIRL